MVAVGALGLLGVEILAPLSVGDTAKVQGLAWRFGFVGAMLVNLKQANPVLLALVTAGLLFVALRDPAIRLRRVLVQLPRMRSSCWQFVPCQFVAILTIHRAGRGNTSSETPPPTFGALISPASKLLIAGDDARDCDWH